MEWTKSGDDLLVRIDPGEEIHSSLQKLADEVGFSAAAITSGIGRTRENIYGYMNNDGVYIKRNLEPPSELVSLSGNIARTQDGMPFTTSIVAGQRMIIPSMQDTCFPVLSQWLQKSICGLCPMLL